MPGWSHFWQYGYPPRRLLGREVNMEWSFEVGLLQRMSQSCLVFYWATLLWSQTVRGGAHGLV